MEGVGGVSFTRGRGGRGRGRGRGGHGRPRSRSKEATGKEKEQEKNQQRKHGHHKHNKDDGDDQQHNQQRSKEAARKGKEQEQDKKQHQRKDGHRKHNMDDRDDQQERHKEGEEGGRRGRGRRRGPRKKKGSKSPLKDGPHAEGPHENKKGGRRRNDNARDRRRNRVVKGNNFFEDYLDEEAIKKGIEEKRIFVGVLRISGKNRLEGYVTSSDVSRDIYIDGEQARNRAFHGDVVAVELDPESEWNERTTTGHLSELEAAFANLEIKDDKGLWQPMISANHPAAAAPDKVSKKKVFALDTGNLQPRGHVVGILASSEEAGISVSRLDTHKHIGVLTPHYGFDRTRPSVLVKGEPLPASEKIVEFRPLDSRVPFMHIPRSEVPFEFTADPFSFAPPNQRLVEVSLVSWDAMYRFPKGRFLRIVGEAGEIGPETEALLIETNCDHGEFPEEAVDVLRDIVPDEGLWQIPEEEIAKRKDLRQSRRIFTIDPSTAKDLDDAVHCFPVAGGEVKGKNGAPLPAHYEIGVHIADVSYFVDPDTPLDTEAQRRATSVYLVNKVVPMLPPILSEDLCSLNEGVDRLAYSCIWRMSEDGDILENAPPPWFGRTVIRSCARLDYGTAQKIVDGTVTADSGDTDNVDDSDRWPERRQPKAPITKQEVVTDVRNLTKIAMNRRKKRFDRTKGGALQLSAVKLYFTRDEKGNPTGVCEYPIRDSNKTIEEYMLMANYLVAQQLILGGGECAFIRHHPPPDAKQMQQLTQLLDEHGIDFDVASLGSAGGLQATLEHLQRTQSQDMMNIIFVLLRKPMKQAQYATAGALKQKNWRHWALNIPYYTHFTSPIRRYPDIIVHRQLTAVLDGTFARDEYPDSQEDLDELADHCNEKKEAAKMAGDASDRLFLCLMIRSKFEKGEPIEAHGVVEDLGPNSFELLLTEYGVQCRVHAEKEWLASKVRPIFRDDGEKQQQQQQQRGGSNKKDNNDKKKVNKGPSYHDDDIEEGDSKKGGHKKKNNKPVEALNMIVPKYQYKNQQQESDAPTSDNEENTEKIQLKGLTRVMVVLEPTLTAAARIGFKTRYLSMISSGPE